MGFTTPIRAAASSSGSTALRTGMRALELSYLLLRRPGCSSSPEPASEHAWEDYLRITTLQPTEVLREAVERMTPVVLRYAAEAKARA
jgi:aspartate/methionine/tyrosine aminotransferase